MKKLLLIVAAAGAIFGGQAALPKRSLTAPGAVKQLTKREAPQKAAQAAVVYYESTEGGITVPFTHTLGKNAAYTSDYVVIDANGDEKTWKPGGFTEYSVCMVSTSKTATEADDWMISPAITLEGGQLYTVKFDYDMTLSKTEEKLALYAGTAQTVEAMTITIVPEFAYGFNNKVFRTKEAQFQVPESGEYYFGFHCTSEVAKSGNPKLCNFSIKKKGEEVVPPAAGSVEMIPDPKGQLKATVKYTAPTVDQEGNPLTQLTQAVVTVNWAYKTILTDIEPGGEYTFETTDVYNNAYNRVEAIAYIGEEAGEPALLTDVFCGMDLPLPPTNVKATLSEDYNSVILTWDPITNVGEKGGYVDTSDVTYYVFDAFGSYYDPALIETKELTATFDYSDLEGQDFVAFQVTAGVGENYSLDESSNIVIVGQPEPLPFHESFADGYYSQAWAVDLESSGRVLSGTIFDNELQTNADADEGTEPEYLNSHDADNGFFYMMPMDINSAYGLFSTKISLQGAENPVFELWYQGKGSILDAKVAADGGDFEAVKSINLKEEPTEGWTLCRIDLAPYKSARYIQIGFLLRAVHNTDDAIWSVPVDNIRVIDLQEQALRVSVASIAQSVKAGEEIPVMMTVENIGLNPLTEAHMAVNIDGEDVDPEMFGSLQPGEVASARIGVPTSVLSADQVTVTAHAKSSADRIHHTAAQDVTINFARHPMPEAFDATANTISAELSWAAPDLAKLTAPKPIEESFESKEVAPFSYAGYEDWLFVDLDGAKNYTIFGDINNPYRTQPMAYQLFTPAIAGIQPEKMIDCTTHSGESMLVAWSCQSQNANLLISPELSGEAQTITFWGRGFTIAPGEYETFSVWYSTTDTQTASFTEVQEIQGMPESGIVPEVWTEFSFEVPEGAKYFAVLHDSYNSWCLFLDDFSFHAAGELPADTELTGYNLYVNGQKAAETAETEAVHTPEEYGTYEYRLSAQYNNGESRATAPISLEFKESVGIVQVADGVSISRNGQSLTISAPAGTPLAITNIQGQTLARGTSTLTFTIPAGQKILLVTAGSTTAKLSL